MTQSSGSVAPPAPPSTWRPPPAPFPPRAPEYARWPPPRQKRTAYAAGAAPGACQGRALNHLGFDPLKVIFKTLLSRRRNLAHRREIVVTRDAPMPQDAAHTPAPTWLDVEILPPLREASAQTRDNAAGMAEPSWGPGMRRVGRSEWLYTPNLPTSRAFPF
jgi:hypothetical protein